MAHHHGERATAGRHHGEHGDAPVRWALLYYLGMRVWGPGRRWRDDIAGRLSLRPGDRVLDVGCGPGRLAVTLGERVSPGGRVDGVDAAAEMVDRARMVAARRNAPAAFQVATAQHLPFAGDTFDALTCTLAWHHIAAEDRARAAREMMRVLKPGGVLLVADGQPPPGRWSARLAERFAGHIMDQSLLDQVANDAWAAGFADLLRDNSTTSWIGVVTARKPAGAGDV